MTPRINVKTFFDRIPVSRATHNLGIRWLSKLGAFTRRIARSSIRKRKGASAPGMPPHSHEGGLRRGIRFGSEDGGETMFAGPIPYIGQNSRNAAKVLEFGGSAIRWPLRHQRRRGQERRPYRATYEARPFMGPAFVKAIDTLKRKQPDDFPKFFTQYGGGGS
jgi:hypothetical protein